MMSKKNNSRLQALRSQFGIVLVLGLDRDGNCSVEEIEVDAAIGVGAAMLGLRLGSKMCGKIGRYYPAHMHSQ
jgi:hypothetical protein